MSHPISSFLHHLTYKLGLRSQNPNDPQEAEPTEGVREIPLTEKYFSTTFYDPNPHRLNPKSRPVSERKLPFMYSCKSCGEKIHIKTISFEKHCNLDFSNLSADDNAEFEDYIHIHHLSDLSFLDFNCPGCKMPTKLFYTGGPSGYGGEFGFEVKRAVGLWK